MPETIYNAFASAVTQRPPMTTPATTVKLPPLPLEVIVRNEALHREVHELGRRLTEIVELVNDMDKDIGDLYRQVNPADKGTIEERDALRWAISGALGHQMLHSSLDKVSTMLEGLK